MGSQIASMPVESLRGGLPMQDAPPVCGSVQELESALSRFEATRGEWMRRIALRIGGFQQSFGNNPVGRFILKHFTTRLIAKVLVRFHVLDVAKSPAHSAPDLVYDWLKLAKFFHAPVEIESVAPNRVVVCHRECTMGFKPGQGKLCRSSMNMDVEIIRRLGGKMTIEYTLAEGADHCRHVIDFPDPARKSASENSNDPPHPSPLPQAGEGGRRPGEGIPGTQG